MQPLNIPHARIAKHPPYQRGSTRLLHLRDGSVKTHPSFNNLLQLLQPNDLLIINNTKVVPCYLKAKKNTGGTTHITITHLINEHLAWSMIKSPPKDGVCHIGDDTLNVQKQKQQFFLIKSNTHTFSHLLAKYGKIMLPPYLKRETQKKDAQDYQSCFAQHTGSIAAPTASLHFNARLLSRLNARGIQIAPITLHVGLGTFLPITTKRIEEHKMHTEYFYIPRETAKCIENQKKQKKRIIAVGTTALRTLESAAINTQNVRIGWGNTRLFIYPGYSFKMVDGLVTNFHQPTSTLMQLVCAFSGKQTINRAYQYALQKKWNFFSYGDAMFLERASPIDLWNKYTTTY